MKSGFERIGRTVTVETAQKGCFGKVRYESRNIARDRATKLKKKYPDSPRQRPYRCTLCGGVHLTSQIPNGLKDRSGEALSDSGHQQVRAPQYGRLPEEG